MNWFWTDPGVNVMMLALTGVLGTIIGSFLNVVIWRVPRGQSLNRPASACPRCDHPIRARDNIPVISWIVLRARCRDCRAPISWRYPAVEVATGVLFVLLAVRFGFGYPEWIALIAFLYLGAISVALGLIDIDTHRLPNAIVLPSYGVGLVLLFFATVASGDWGALLRAVIGAAALFVFYFALAFAYPAGMGLGDVKLAGVLGLYLGWTGWDALVVGAFAAFVLGGVFSIALITAGRAHRKSGIPFGPWMLVGAMSGIFFGDAIASGYLAAVGLV